MIENNIEFKIPKDGYLSFDALTLKQFIKDRLNDSKLFTDQNYEGSYMSTLNEIIAYTFHTLMYYLNRTSTESMFAESQIYENMNRIVKLLDYKPIGDQVPTTAFCLSGLEFIPNGVYTIPRYSYISNGNISYSINEDIVISKADTDVLESFDNAVSQKLLYQGYYTEYPLYRAVGNPSEVVFFFPNINTIVDHFNIDIYVYETDTSKWYAWKRVPTLYMENGFSRSYEIRLNENKQYEIKFGNDINGKQLRKNDKVQIYYIESLGSKGEIGKGSINEQPLKIFSSNTLTSILRDLNTQEGNRYTYIGADIANNLIVTNINNSTYFQTSEDVDSIRKNTPGVFRSQYRVVTEQDYENYIKTNFANLIHDIKVVNNWTYISEQLKYYYEDLGIRDPNNISNILYNQVQFADACNFNNIYITTIPKTIYSTKNPTSVLSPAQKELITSSLKNVKTLTSEIILLDPVYIAVDICALSSGSTEITDDDINNTQLQIVKDLNSRRDNNSLILDVLSVFENYFSRENMKLGQMLDVSDITTSILSIPGVKNINTIRKDNPNIGYTGLSMVSWNPVYPVDCMIITKNTPFSYFKYLYLNNRERFKDKITVSNTSRIYENIEY